MELSLKQYDIRKGNKHRVRKRTTDIMYYIKEFTKRRVSNENEN